MTPELLAAINEVIACLEKYQARYHQPDHAQKDWNRSKEALQNLKKLLSDK